MDRVLSIYFLFGSIILVGCAATQPPTIDREDVEKENIIQKRMELENTLRYQKRLDRISYPILKGGYSFCNDKVTFGIGMRVANTDSFPKELRHVAKTRLGFEQGIKVLWVLDNGPADIAGIRAGDQIIALDSKSISIGKDGLEEYEDILRSALKNNTQLKIGVLRDNQEIIAIVNPDKICSYPVIVALDATPNAYADGSKIVVNSGLLRLFEDDRDVSIILGHELAHNVSGHMAKGMLALGLGIIVELALDIDEVAGMVMAPFSPPLEAEADYVGLYIAANSGVDIEGAENVWRTFASEFAGAKEKTLTDTHPPTPKRYVALRRTIQEIKDKRVKGLPIVPNK